MRMTSAVIVHKDAATNKILVWQLKLQQQKQKQKQQDQQKQKQFTRMMMAAHVGNALFFSLLERASFGRNGGTTHVNNNDNKTAKETEK